MRHVERHRQQRSSWLRAGVLGANDGIISTASLILGVTAAGASPQSILVAGMASLVAGALSMAAGEFVSVSSQADTERADLERERLELAADPEHEHVEMTAIYVSRGLDPELAARVTTQLMQHDALGAHAREELGIHEAFSAQPIQAALVSAGSFALGASQPLTASLLVAMFLPASLYMPTIFSASLLCVALLGALAARLGGASPWRASLRLAGWGCAAMIITTGVGVVFKLTV
ncbi:VIT1/CCC1 transporter family protein [Uliginosibacterium gangwonense]|uniref:VIT1/CCC1 transporter family protein n=1 Tax=Uliginosibacterium gangwonense TaxID=392736 RepID=UPI00035F5EB6|nr:VIT family protein [Uliginosibacterium gangwonense]